MSKTTKLLLLSMTICLGLTIGLNTLAQEEIIEEVILDETVKAEDLEVKEPWLLPDNPFYFVKDWGRGIRSFFTFDKVKKAELESKYANERLIEIKKMVEKNKGAEAIKKATEKYKKTLDEVRSRAEKIKEKAQQNPKVEKFMEKYTDHQIHHQKLLEKLEQQVPPEAFEKIKEARERHIERFKDVMLKLEEKDRIPQRLKETFEKQKGSEFKDFKNLEIMGEIRERMPEEVREKIQEKEGEIIREFMERLEKLPAEKQERFKKYIETIPGQKEKQLEILESIRLEVRGRPEFEEKLREARERVMESVPVEIELEKLDCLEIEKPSRDSCQKGRIIIERDERGCVTSFRCVIPGEAGETQPGGLPVRSVPEVSAEGVCPTVWDPVCGADGKTYSNKCYARLRGVVAAYRGNCKREGIREEAKEVKEMLEERDRMIKELQP